MRNQLRHLSMKWQMLLCFVPLFVISVLLVFGFVINNYKRQQQQEAYYQLRLTVNHANMLLSDRLERVLITYMEVENSNAFSKAVLTERYGLEGIYSKTENLIEMGNLLNDLYERSYDMVDSVYIRMNENEFTMMKRYRPIFQSIDTEIFQKEKQYESNRYYWEGLHDDIIFTDRKEKEVFSLVKVMGTQDSNLYGAYVMNIRKDYILQTFRDFSIGENGYLLLINGEQIYSTETAAPWTLADETLEFLKNVTEEGNTQQNSKAGVPVYIAYSPIKISGWTLAAVLPQREMITPTINIDYNYSNLSFLIVIIIVMIVIAFFLAEGVSGSVQALSEDVKKFDRGDFPMRFHSNGTREVRVLANALNQMLETIRRLFEDVKKEQDMKRELELYALQEQIKPHFIYNTLSSIMYEVDSGENKNASEMIGALIAFLQLSINHGREMVSVADELDHVRNYLYIQSKRFSHTFTYEIHADEDLLTCMVLRFTLQPLVENSLAHGFEDRKNNKENLIVISVYENDGICMEVMDNGCGMSESSLKQINESIVKNFSQYPGSFYGLKNINQRIKLRFGSQYGITLESEEGSYMLVRVWIPRLEQGENV